MFFNSLCRDFKTVSIRTWKKLRDCYKYKMEISEETITDNNLLFLAKKQHKTLICKKFNRIEENRTGSDWEWWILQRNKHIKLRIQAKKLNNYSYKHIIYYQNNQLDKLIDEAYKYDMTPLYILYNYWNYRNYRPSYNCCSSKSLQLLGCAMCSANLIKKKIVNSYGISIQNIDNDILPMSCLVCCPNSVGNTSLEKITSIIKKLDSDISINIFENKLPSYIRNLLSLLTEDYSDSIDYSDMSKNTGYVTIMKLNEP